MGSVIIEKLIQYEAEHLDKLLSFCLKYDKLPLWLLLRNRIFLETISVNNNMNTGYLPEKTPFWNKIAYLIYSVIYSVFFIRRKFDIVIFSHDSGLNITKKDKWFNPVSDYYGDMFPENTLLLYNIIKSKIKVPKYARYYAVFNSITVFTYFNCFFSNKKVNLSDIETIHEFFNYLNATYPYQISNDLKVFMIDYYKRLSLRLPFYHSFIRKMIFILKPKIVFWEDASYMTSCFFIKWIKDEGIPVGEFQHGYVGLAHRAYNYSDTINQNLIYRRYLPDYFLTHGDFWNTNIRLPSKVHTIGNPHFTESMKKYCTESTNRMRTLLFISDGMTSTATNNFMINLAEKMLVYSDIHIIFRPHPSEIKVFHDRYKELLLFKNLEVSLEGDIYPIINNSSWVCGTYSTVLFEAAALLKTVFVWRTEGSIMYIPSHFGIWIDSPEDLCNYLTIDSHDTISMINPEFYFNTHWRDRYSAFLKDIGINEHFINS